MNNHWEELYNTTEYILNFDRDYNKEHVTTPNRDNVIDLVQDASGTYTSVNVI